MYSVVLMVALSGGAEAPAWHGGHGCNGGGCVGGSSCHGGGLFSHGCSGGHAASHGCHGGGLFSHGCSGGHAASHGCHGGGLFSHGCNGGHAASHGCNGGGLFSHGCHGGGGLFHKSHGCHGGSGCMGVSHGCTGGTMIYSAPMMHGEMIAPPMHSNPPPVVAPPPVGETPRKTPPVKPITAAPQAAPATIVVKLPADAKLLINDMTIDAAQETRIFRSRDIAMGQSLDYTVKATIVRDGQTLTASKLVKAEPGVTSDVELQFPTATVAAK